MSDRQCMQEWELPSYVKVTEEDAKEWEEYYGFDYDFVVYSERDRATSSLLVAMYVAVAVILALLCTVVILILQLRRRARGQGTGSQQWPGPGDESDLGPYALYASHTADNHEGDEGGSLGGLNQRVRLFCSPCWSVSTTEKSSDCVCYRCVRVI
jgi:hypothetical protein